MTSQSPPTPPDDASCFEFVQRIVESCSANRFGEVFLNSTDHGAFAAELTRLIAGEAKS